MTDFAKYVMTQSPTSSAIQHHPAKALPWACCRKPCPSPPRSTHSVTVCRQLLSENKARGGHWRFKHVHRRRCKRGFRKMSTDDVVFHSDWLNTWVVCFRLLQLCRPRLTCRSSFGWISGIFLCFDYKNQAKSPFSFLIPGKKTLCCLFLSPPWLCGELFKEVN